MMPGKSIWQRSQPKDLNTVSHIFTTAVREWGVEAANPVLIIKKPKAPAGRLRFLTDGEIVNLLRESRKGHRKNLYHFLLLQLHTGCGQARAHL
jgi:site-specific recombinase XerD